MTTPLTDPRPRTVCGGLLDQPTLYPSAEYGGQTVYFCLRACQRVFEQDPDRFIAGEMAHPAEEDADSASN